MGGSYYDPGKDRAAKVNRLFGTIARRYDLINDLQSFGLHRYWKRRLVELGTEGQGGGTALDTCCGTGDIAFRLAAKGLRVAGLDFSLPMMTVASRRHPGETGNILFLQADALRIPFADNSFDTVTIGYGLRNLSDLDSGIREMRRVAKPGGRLLALDFGKPDWKPWRYVYYAYLRCVVPVFGLLFCRDASAYGYILESLRHYPAQHGVAELMRKCRCVNVRVVSFLGGMMAINYAEKEK